MMHKDRYYFRFRFSAVVLLAILTLCACSGTDSPLFRAKKRSDRGLTVLTIGTADSGGSMYPAGQAIAAAVEDSFGHIRMNISASTGSYTNISQLMDGQIDLGLVSGDAAYSAYHGTHDFKGDSQKGLYTIGAVYSSVSNWMVPSSSPLFYVHDLKGKKVSVGPEESTTDLSARIVLEQLGITAENTALDAQGGIGFGAEQVFLGNLDAVHGFAGIPVDGLSGLASRTPARLLKYTPEELSDILSENSFYYKTVIPAGTYQGQAEDIDSFGVKCLVCVNESMDEQLVYELTSILYENREALAEKQEILSPMTEEGFMYQELPIPLHPGALRFYREKGLLP